MRSSVLAGAVATAVVLWALAAGGAQDGLTKRDTRGPVTVAVTLGGPPAAGAALRFRLVLDTHSVNLDGIVLEQAVSLRAADGSAIAPTAVEDAKGGGHHREAVIVFPPPAQPGPVRIVVRDVGGIPERDFVLEPAGR